MKKFLTLIALLFVVVQTASSMPADSRPGEYPLPDGTSITVQLFGDEFFSYMLTSDGYQVTTLDDGFLYYYKEGVGTKAVTAMRASSPNRRSAAERSYVSTLRRGVDPAFENMGRSIAAHRRSMMSNDNYNEYAPFTSVASKNVATRAHAPRCVVILCQYQDVKFLPSTTKETFVSMLNQVGYSANGSIGSAHDYFVDNSFGAYSPHFDVTDIITLPEDMEYYGRQTASANDIRPREMVIDACKLASQGGVDFSQYDFNGDGKVENVFLFYAGHNEAERAHSSTIWPHRWFLNAGQSSNLSIQLNGKWIDEYACTSELRGSSGTELCGIGTFVHEFGHVLGLPDFYDTDNSNSGGTTPGLYNSCVMSSGGYNANGKIPPYYTGIEREIVGWGQMKDIKDAPDNLTIHPIHTKEGTDVWKIETGNPGEIFYLESRQSTRWDAPISTEGLMIYHIDRSAGYAARWRNNAINVDPSHPCARVIESAGRTTSDGAFGQIFYPGSNNVTTFLPGSQGFGSWASVPLPVGLSGISQSNGMVTLRVVKDLKLGAVEGTVKDDANANLQAVRVSFIEVMESSDAPSNGMLRTISKSQVEAARATSVVYTAITEGNGRYIMANLPYATYDVMFERVGYDSFIAQVVVDEKNQTLDAQLKRFVAQLLSQKSWNSGVVNEYLDMTGSLWVGSSWSGADLASMAGKRVGGIAVETGSATTYEVRLLVNDALKYTSRGTTVNGGRTIAYLPTMMDITISESDEVRVEFNVASAEASIGIDEGPAVKGKGDLYSENGQSWKNLSDNGVDANLAISLLFAKDSDIPDMPSVIASPSQRSCVLQFSTTDGNITSWNLRYKEAGAADWTQVPDVKSSNHTITNLNHETTYEAELEAVFAGKKSDPKKFTFSTIGLTAPFAAIGGVKARYAVGESYTLNSVNVQAETESVEWRWNGGVIRSESLVFGSAGTGRLDCVITYKDGSKEVLSRQIAVQ